MWSYRLTTGSNQVAVPNLGSQPGWRLANSIRRYSSNPSYAGWLPAYSAENPNSAVIRFRLLRMGSRVVWNISAPVAPSCATAAPGLLSLIEESPDLRVAGLPKVQIPLTD